MGFLLVTNIPELATQMGTDSGLSLITQRSQWFGMGCGSKSFPSSLTIDKSGFLFLKIIAQTPVR